MAEERDEERTEPATPRRREEARERGQVARSGDLSSAVILLAAVVALKFLGKPMIGGLFASAVSVLEGLALWTGRRLPAALGVDGSSACSTADLLPDGLCWNSPLVEIHLVDKKRRRSRLARPATAVQSTVVNPIGNRLPDGGSHVTVTLVPHVLVARTAKLATAPPNVLHASVMFVGQRIDTHGSGEQSPVTMTGNVQRLICPASSLALQTTVLVPTGNTLPEGGLQTTVTFESHWSLAVTVKWTVPPSGRSQGARSRRGQNISGGVRSRTVMLKVHPLEFPETSVNAQRTVVTPGGKRLPGGGEQSRVRLLEQWLVAKGT